MAHKRHPETKEFIHHWIVGTTVVHLEDGDEGYFEGNCKVKRCKVVKYFPASPAISPVSQWRLLKTERAKATRMTVKP